MATIQFSSSQHHFLALLYFWLIVTLQAETIIPAGDVSGTWTLANSPYLIEDEIRIPMDSTLAIEPGVIIEFQGHYALEVQGTLLATGTEMDTIRFTVNDTSGFSNPDTSLGGWHGIRFTYPPAHDDTSKIVYCRLEYGKAIGPEWYSNNGGALCILQCDKVFISNCLFTNNMAASQEGNLRMAGALYFYDSDIVVENNTFAGNKADAGGAIYFDNANPLFRNNMIRANRAIDGGGMAVRGNSSPTFTGDKILHNRASNNGGGLSILLTSLCLCNNLIVSGNKARWGAGIGIFDTELEANQCQFSGNRAEVWGGGLAGDFATLHLNNCTFTQDTSDWGSGGLQIDHTKAQIIGCEFRDNQAILGGGFHSVYSQLIFEENDFLNNLAATGAGAQIEDCDLDMANCLFEGNYAYNGSGGAIDYSADTTIFGYPNNVRITNSSFLENSSTTNSGALRIDQLDSELSLIDIFVDQCEFMNNTADIYASLRISGYISDFMVSNCWFSGNTSKRYVAGAGFIDHCTGKLVNCLFSCNYASYSDSTANAQGVSLGSESIVDIFNCTFFDSSSAGGSGLSLRRGSRATITNSILWGCGDTPINIFTAAGLGCTIDVNHCAIENGIDSISVSDTLSNLNWGVGNIEADPMFVNANNMDFHLQPTSPCIGTGINCLKIDDQWFCCPTFDIEGNMRPNPGGSFADMGAYEHELGSPLGIAYTINLVPQEFHLFQNYPNPFNLKTVISYQLPAFSYVDLSIYNILGQKVATLVSKQQPAGKYNVPWEASPASGGQGFASGVYLYRLSTDQGFMQTKKLVLLR